MSRPFSPADRVLGQIRHIQHHVGCMSLIRRHQTGRHLPWIGFGEDDPH